MRYAIPCPLRKLVMKNISMFVLALLFIFTAKSAYSENANILFNENFHDLTNWKPLYFPKIEKHSSYEIEVKGNDSYLKTTSNASASGIVYKEEFNVYEFPNVAWQWRVENVYKNGDAKTKAGDDYPLRIYIIFKYDPEKAGFWDKVKYKAAKLVYGEYPPHSSLNYIWANKEHDKSLITSAYTEKSRMILLQQGASNIGKWLTQDINIIEDYKTAFGTPPPATGSIAIMNDSDNTKEESTSYINFIKVYTTSRASPD